MKQLKQVPAEHVPGVLTGTQAVVIEPQQLELTQIEPDPQSLSAVQVAHVKLQFVQYTPPSTLCTHIHELSVPHVLPLPPQTSVVGFEQTGGEVVLVVVVGGRVVVLVVVLVVVVGGGVVVVVGVTHVPF